MKRPQRKLGAFFFEEGGLLRLITLSDYFFDSYAGCTEILQKRSRPYACLEVSIDGIPFAVPFRHHISHGWAYITYDRCGLDYTKAIVLADKRFVGSEDVSIEQREFDALKGKEHRIVSGMRKYLAVYKKSVQYADNPRYDRIRLCSTLQYFHAELSMIDQPCEVDAEQSIN